MHSPLIAVALCIVMHAANAECAVPAASGHGSPQALTPVSAHVPGTTAATTQPSGELIKSAAASTRDAPVMRARPRADDESDHPRRAGTAMLLAALALMSGIALRRFGGPRP